MNIETKLRSVPMVDLAAQRGALAGGIDAAVARVLAHGRFVLGPEVEQLEAALARRTGTACVTCANGTDALVLALRGLGIGPGDGVVVPAFTFAATAEAVVLAGATPVFADAEAEGYNLCPDSAAAAFAAARQQRLRARALIAVDLFGLPADYAALEPLAAGEGATLIADAAQSFGALRAGRPVGALAPITTVSFYPSKPLGCYGDGGAIFARDAVLAERLRCLARHGEGQERYRHELVGMNSRLDTLQAAILLAKLAVFDEEIAARERAASRYDAAFHGRLGLPARMEGTRSVWANYTLRHPERDRLARGLAEAGIMTAVHYPLPLSAQSAFRGFPVAAGGLWRAERLAREVLSLPLHGYLDEATQDRVIDCVLRLA